MTVKTKTQLKLENMMFNIYTNLTDGLDSLANKLDTYYKEKEMKKINKENRKMYLDSRYAVCYSSLKLRYDIRGLSLVHSDRIEYNPDMETLIVKPEYEGIEFRVYLKQSEN